WRFGVEPRHRQRSLGARNDHRLRGGHRPAPAARDQATPRGRYRPVLVRSGQGLAGARLARRTRPDQHARGCLALAEQQPPRLRRTDPGKENAHRTGQLAQPGNGARIAPSLALPIRLPRALPPFQPDETATGIDFTPWKMAGLWIDA